MANRCVLLALILISLIIAGCGGGGGNGGTDNESDSSAHTLTAPEALRGVSGTVPLTASPLNMDDIGYITPLGNLNPPGHSFPTSHMYFVYSNKAGLRNVYAPADGYIIKIKANTQNGSPVPNDFTVYFAYTSTFFSYFGHVLELDSSITSVTGQITQNGDYNVEIPVQAGQLIGKSGQGGITMALDFGLINREYTAPGIVNPNRYEADFVHKESCLKYYLEPLKTQLYGKVNSLIQEKDGKFDYDVAGTLAGNWVGPGYGTGGDATSYANQLAFTGSIYNHNRLIISMGGDLGLTGYFDTDIDAPVFKNVTPQSGVVSYKLYTVGSNRTTQRGLLLVQMLNNTQIKIQLFSGAVQSATFDSGAKVYSR